MTGLRLMSHCSMRATSSVASTWAGMIENAAELKRFSSERSTNRNTTVVSSGAVTLSICEKFERQGVATRVSVKSS